MQNSVIVIGAGPVGLCLSRALADCGLQVHLVESQSATALTEPEFDGREIALMHASMPPLRRALAAGLLYETPRSGRLWHHVRMRLEVLRLRPRLRSTEAAT